MNHPHRLNDHYPLLLGLDQHREVGRVDLWAAAKQVRSHLQHVLGAALTRPQCQNACSIFDHAPAHESRHLDTLQADPVLRARVPRSHCADGGVKTIGVRWAVKHSPLTWLFETFAVAVRQSVANTQEACIRSFANDCLRILFHYGRLDLKPTFIH
jgi:hypothetical protein